MESKEKVNKLLTSHNIMCLSTIDEAGFPRGRSVNFVIDNNESVLYFITHKLSDKIRHIKHNSNVFLVVDHDCHSMAELQQLVYMRSTDKAYIIDTPEERKSVLRLLVEKFPYMLMIDQPFDAEDLLAVRVELGQAVVFDNTVQFGHREEILYR